MNRWREIKVKWEETEIETRRKAAAIWRQKDENGNGRRKENSNRGRAGIDRESMREKAWNAQRREGRRRSRWVTIWSSGKVNVGLNWKLLLFEEGIKMIFTVCTILKVNLENVHKSKKIEVSQMPNARRGNEHVKIIPRKMKLSLNHGILENLTNKIDEGRWFLKRKKWVLTCFAIKLK